MLLLIFQTNIHLYSYGYWLLNRELWVHSQVTYCDIRGEQSGTGVGFSQSFLVSLSNLHSIIVPCSYHSPFNVCNSLHKAAYHHILKVWDFISDFALCWIQSKLICFSFSYQGTTNKATLFISYQY